jgi:hypothetical protein
MQRSGTSGTFVVGYINCHSIASPEINNIFYPATQPAKDMGSPVSFKLSAQLRQISRSSQIKKQSSHTIFPQWGQILK